MKRIIALLLLLSAPAASYAGAVSQLRSAAPGAPSAELLPAPPAATRVDEERKPAKQRRFVYESCFRDAKAARTELDRVLGDLTAARVPVLESSVWIKSGCVDYDIWYASNLRQLRFAFSGWYGGFAPASAELERIRGGLKAAGVPVLSAYVRVDNDKERYDYVIALLADARVRSFTYATSFPTAAAAAAALRRAEAGLIAGGMPVLEARVRDQGKIGYDYVLWYLSPK